MKCVGVGVTHHWLAGYISHHFVNVLGHELALKPEGLVLVNVSLVDGLRLRSHDHMPLSESG